MIYNMPYEYSQSSLYSTDLRYNDKIRLYL